MQIAVALDRPNSRRDLTLFVGDLENIALTVYRADGDDTPLTTEVENAAFTFYPDQAVSIPVGTDFTVPDDCERANYRLSADIDGDRRTLCTGVLWIRGGQQTSRNDYGGPAA